MKLKTLFMINAVIAIVYGICFVLIPSQVLLVYGLTAGAGEVLMGQYFGVALIGIGLITWLIKNVTEPNATGAVILALLIGTISGVMNTFGWSAVIIYLFLTIGFAYFQFKKPTKS